MSLVARYLPIILATAFWGGNANVGKVVVGYLPPVSGAALRFVLATIVTMALLLAREALTWADIRPRLRWYVLLGVIGIFGFNVFFFLGLQYTSPVNSSLIMATNPVWTMVAAALLLRERMRRNQKAGVVISFAGIFFVITGGSWTMLTALHVSRGDLFILVAGGCWAIYSVLLRKYLADSTTMATTALTMLFGTLAMIPFALAERRVVVAEVPSFVWLGILYMAIPGAVLAYLFWNRGMTTIGPARAAVFYNLIPVFTMLISVLSGDRITPAQAIGGLVVITGCVISQKA